MPRARRVAAVGAFLALFATGPTGAQAAERAAGPAAPQEAAGAAGAVRAARVVVDLTAADGSADVTLEYEVAGADPDGPPVSARALAFGAARVAGVTAGGRPVGSDPAAATDVARRFLLPLAPGPGGEGAGLLLRYRVPEAAVAAGVALRFQVPLLTLELPPEASRPGLFRLEVRMPPGWSFLEGFPTVLAAVPDLPGVYRAELPVVPSVVGVRVRSDGSWRPGLPLLLDGLAVAVLLGFFAVAWRHLRVEP